MKYKDADFSKWDSRPSEEVFKDWVLMRKTNRAPTTQTALNRGAKWVNLLFHMGYESDLTLSIACEMGWKGLEWIYEDQRKRGFPEAPKTNGHQVLSIGGSNGQNQRKSSYSERRDDLTDSLSDYDRATKF